MPQTDPPPSLNDQVAELRRERAARAAFGGYSRLYGPIAVASFVLSCFPEYGSVVGHGANGGSVTTIHNSIWYGPDSIGLLLLIIVTGLLVGGAFSTSHPALPTAIAVAEALTLLKVLLLPLVLLDRPGLSASGGATVGLAVLTMALCGAHIYHLLNRRDLWRPDNAAGGGSTAADPAAGPVETPGT